MQKLCNPVRQPADQGPLHKVGLAVFNATIEIDAEKILNQVQDIVQHDKVELCKVSEEKDYKIRKACT